MGKINRLPRAHGSGVKPLLFGEVWSADFKPVNPQSIAHHIGFYLFAELSRGYLMAFLIKEHREC